MFSPQLANKICQQLNLTEITEVNKFKTLWSDFGAMYRVRFANRHAPIVIKAITQPSQIKHPKGWQSELATKRKLTSYQVEQCFYANYSHLFNAITPCYLGTVYNENSQYLLLSDLAENAFSEINQGDIESVKRCLAWLATLHAAFVNTPLDGLWQQGSYWHLATRQDELNAIESPHLKQSAQLFDAALNACPYQTLIHGDAKIANFMQSKENVAGFDFQYAGKGVGIVDVMLLLSSAFNSDELFTHEATLLNHYHTELVKAFAQKMMTNGAHIADAWLDLYDLAWADFVRFLAGWSPNHWKLHDYAYSKLNRALIKLKKA